MEDDATDVQHLLAEPKTDHVSVDGMLCFGKENSWKQLELDDFAYGFGYGLERNCGNCLIAMCPFYRCFDCLKCILLDFI